MRSFQTPHHRLGGVLTAVAPTVSTHEFIRSFEQNVIWSIATVKVIRIHLINVYAPDSSKTKEEKDKVLKWTEFIISQKILKVNAHEYLLIGGDFTKEFQAHENMLIKLSRTSLLPSGTVTHLQGGH